MENSSNVGGRCPVIKFDHASQDHAENWVEKFEKIRAETPRPWTETYGGYWVASRYKDIIRINQSPDLFSNGKQFNPETGEVSGGVLIPAPAIPATIPEEIDKPEWRGYRSFLDPKFSPKMAEQRRGIAKAIARTLIDRVIEKGHMDIVEDLTNPLPSIFTMQLLGFDLNDWREFAEPVHKFMYYRSDDPEFPQIVAGIERIRQRLADGAIERRANPRDDLLSEIANGEINGERMSLDEVIRMSTNIIFGGVDTTTALTSSTLRYLSQNPIERRRLIDDPSLRAVAREECVRFFGPVHAVGRNATDTFDFDGWKFQKGDRVLLAYASGNRDTDVFEDADKLRIDRLPNRHIGFGSGMHRCLGSFFARVMFDAILAEVLERIPDYHVIEDQTKPYPSVAAVNGWITMPATFTPGVKLGGGLEF